MNNIVIFLASQFQNKTLGEAIKAEIETHDQAVKMIDIVDYDFPLYSSKSESELGIPSGIHDLFQECLNAKAFVFVAPEYNGGIPPVLTNMIAWLSVTGKTWREAFNTKRAGIATFSGGGGMQLIMGLRGQLAYLGLTVIGLPILTNYQKPLKQDDLVSFSKQIIQGLSD